MRTMKWLAALLALCLLSGLIPAATMEDLVIGNDIANSAGIEIDGEATDEAGLDIAPDISADADDGIALESEGIDLSVLDLELSDGEMASLALPATNDGQSLVRITKPVNGAAVNTGTLEVWCVFVNPGGGFDTEDAWKYMRVNYVLLRDGRQVSSGAFSGYSRLVFVDDGIEVGTLTIPEAGSYTLTVSVPGSPDAWDSIDFKAYGETVTPPPTPKPTPKPTPEPIVTTDDDGFGVDQTGVLREYTGDAKDIVIPGNVKKIGEMAFAGKDIQSVAFHGQVTDILADSFSECTSLTDVKLVNGLKSIGDFAFCRTGLKTLDIPDTVTAIGEDAFLGSYALTSVSIPASVRSMGPYMFSDSENLKTVSFAKGCKLDTLSHDMFYSCTALEEVILPDSLETFGEYTFAYCTSLKSLTLPSGLTTILDYAFQNCTGLKELVIPASVGIIEEHTFEGCSNLTLIVEAGSFAEQYARDIANIPYKTVSASTPTPTSKPTATPTGKPTPIPTGTPTSKPTPAPTSKPTSKPTSAPTSKPTGTPKVNLSKCKATVKNQTYTGKLLKPAVNVKYGKKTLKKGTDYTVTYKNNKAVGTATATLTGKGKYTGTKKVTFKILPPKVALSKLKAGTKSFTASWKKGKANTGYQLQYALKKSFSGAKTLKVAKAGTTSATVTKLKRGKTYYARVRAYKTVGRKNYYSAWSAVKRVKVK